MTYVPVYSITVALLYSVCPGANGEKNDVWASAVSRALSLTQMAHVAIVANRPTTMTCDVLRAEKYVRAHEDV